MAQGSDYQAYTCVCGRLLLVGIGQALHEAPPCDWYLDLMQQVGAVPYGHRFGFEFSRVPDPREAN